MAEVDRVFSQLIQNAIDVCGMNDMPCILAHVEEKAGKLDPQQRAELETMIQRVLGFREPDKPFKDH